MKHGFIGFGNVAKAIYKGLEGSEGLSFSIFSKSKIFSDMNSCSSIEELVKYADIIWICVKPQDLSEVLDEMAQYNLGDKIIVSPVAGKPISLIEESLGTSVSIVRIMPNLAIAYQKSVTAFCSNNKRHFLIDSLKTNLKAMGSLVEVKEIHFDMYTAIFGSGLAFLLSMFNVFKNKIIDLDIADSDAQELLIDLLKGTTAYLENNRQSKLTELIDNITSKGGTTEAGLEYSKKHSLEEILGNVLNQTAQKSKDLQRT